MMLTITIILAVSDYLISANNIYYDIKNSLEYFKDEAIIIDEAKCHLINYKNLDDFSYNGAYAYETGSGYNLVYKGVVYSLEVDEGIILDYSYN